MRTTAMQVLETVKESSRKLGPYVLLELLLPGGTLFALALFLYRRPASAMAWAGRAKALARRAWTRVRRSIARRASLVQTAECAVRRAGLRVASKGRRGGGCVRLPAVRCWSMSWRLPSFTAGRCPALPPPA